MQYLDTRNLYQVAEVELVYKNKVSPRDRIKISNSRDAYNILHQAWDHNKIELLEQFKILLLNRANCCLGIADIGKGGTAHCPADPKIILVTALKANASAVILAHNHPSGNLKASDSDIAVTKNICKASELLGLAICDHIILTAHGYSSMGDDRLLPFAIPQL